MRAALLALLLMATPAAAQEAWLPRGTADLVLLDKIRAQPSVAAVKVGGTTVFGTLTVVVKSCFVRPPDQPADSAAYVEVTDSRGAGQDIFKGWMLSQTPSVSQMEHPVYDLRLAGCR